MRPESLVMGVELNSKKLPTVFKWEGGGKNVTISGSFDNWTRQIPMVKRYLLLPIRNHLIIYIINILFVKLIKKIKKI